MKARLLRTGMRSSSTCWEFSSPVSDRMKPGDKVLTAFIVRREPSDLSIESLRTWLGLKLPDYMVPARFVVITALPLTPNGKVDRKALEKIEGKELSSGAEYAAPRNDRERQLVDI